MRTGEIVFQPTVLYEQETRACFLSRVQRGSAFLEHLDRDWTRRIDVAKLDIMNLNTCALAQFGGTDFETVAATLDLFEDDLVNNGFFIVDEDDERRTWKYQLLTELWQDLLAGNNVPPTIEYDTGTDERVLEDA